MAGVIAIIPARLGSTRFPRKVLHLYREKPLLFYVWRSVCQAKLIDRVVVATDSKEIMRAVEGFGGESVRTRGNHRTGSDRAAEAAAKIGGEIIVNVQGDNFGLQGKVLDRVISEMQRDTGITYATLARRIETPDELHSANMVKVVRGKVDGRALWFSRSPLPFVRGAGKDSLAGYPYLGHIGVYFFRRAGLEQYAKWGQTAAEKAESLEQLRILENGGRMIVYETRMQIVSVDAPEDLGRLDTVYR